MRRLLAFLVLAAVGLASAAAPQAAAEDPWVNMPIPDWCPPATNTPRGDINKDGAQDWRLHTQTDAIGQRVELWCVAGSDATDQPTQYVVVFIGQDGKPYVIGRDPYSPVYFWVNKQHFPNGTLEAVNTTGREAATVDLDGDGRIDEVEYHFRAGASRSLPIIHRDGTGAIFNNSTNITAPVFDDKAVFPSPLNPTKDDFFNESAWNKEGRADARSPRLWTHLAFEVRATRGTAAAVATPVRILLGAEGVASATTDANGSAWFTLEANQTYTVVVEGAPPVNVTLTDPTVRTVAIPAPAQGFLPGPGAAISLSALLGVAAVAWIHRRRSA